MWRFGQVLWTGCANCVIACYVEGDQWWEVMAYRYSWSASADDMIKAVTSGEMTSSM